MLDADVRALARNCPLTLTALFPGKRAFYSIGITITYPNWLYFDDFPWVNFITKPTWSPCQMLKPAPSTSAARRIAAVAHASPLKELASSTRIKATACYRPISVHAVSHPALSPHLRLPLRNPIINSKYNSRAFTSTTRMVRHLSPHYRIQSQKLHYNVAK